MVFSSPEFIFLFLPIFFIIYFCSPTRLKNGVLLMGSLVFYAWGEPVYILLLVIAAFVGYTASLLIEKTKKKGVRRLLLAVSVIIGVGLLGIFKYTDFIVENINVVFGTAIVKPKLALPIGISFFTFQTISYTADVYMGRIRAEKSFVKFLTFICMFPQLIAGPIVRFSDVSAALYDRKHTLEDFSAGVCRFINGLVKKVLIADRLGVLWGIVKASDYGNISVMTAWLGIVCFTFQLYFDFSGYADMAIGMGRMMGFHYNENFDHPLYSKNITHFWRRWHISLSSWFRDYVYIPLGGNRKGVLRHIINILIVWTLTGLWHGASWNFIIWGFYYGVILIGEKYLWGGVVEKLPPAVCYVYSAFIIVIGFGIFDLTDLGSISSYFHTLFFGKTFFDSDFLYYIYNYRFVLLAGAVFAAPVSRLYGNMKEKFSAGQRSAAEIFEGFVRLSAFIAAVSYMITSAYSPFLYFRF